MSLSVSSPYMKLQQKPHMLCLESAHTHTETHTHRHTHRHTQNAVLGPAGAALLHDLCSVVTGQFAEAVVAVDDRPVDDLSVPQHEVRIWAQTPAGENLSPLITWHTCLTAHVFNSTRDAAARSELQLLQHFYLQFNIWFIKSNLTFIIIGQEGNQNLKYYWTYESIIANWW